MDPPLRRRWLSQPPTSISSTPDISRPDTTVWENLAAGRWQLLLTDTYGHHVPSFVMDFLPSFPRSTEPCLWPALFLCFARSHLLTLIFPFTRCALNVFSLLQSFPLSHYGTNLDSTFTLLDASQDCRLLGGPTTTCPRSLRASWRPTLTWISCGFTSRLIGLCALANTILNVW